VTNLLQAQIKPVYLHRRSVKCLFCFGNKDIKFGASNWPPRNQALSFLHVRANTEPSEELKPRASVDKQKYKNIQLLANLKLRCEMQTLQWRTKTIQQTRIYS
jgi:hypothetical protein